MDTELKEMFDKDDVRVLGEKFQKGLESQTGAFTGEQIAALRTAYEIATMNMLVTIQGRVRLKGTENKEDYS